MERKNVWKTWPEEQVKAADAFAREYMDFLDNGKTERECVDTLVNQIEKAGYRELNELVEKGEKVKPGDKVYAVNMNKSLLMYQIGKEPMTAGMLTSPVVRSRANTPPISARGRLMRMTALSRALRNWW